jgi:hypothetical protein
MMPFITDSQFSIINFQLWSPFQLAPALLVAAASVARVATL